MENNQHETTAETGPDHNEHGVLNLNGIPLDKLIRGAGAGALGRAMQKVAEDAETTDQKFAAHSSSPSAR